MSMTTEQAMSYLSTKVTDNDTDKQNVVEDKSITNDSSSEVKEESPKSEEINVDSPDNTTKIDSKIDSNKADNPKDGQSTTEEVNKADSNKSAGSDEPKTTDVADGKKKSHKEQRDYAYIREKQRRKEAEAKVKELQNALEKYKGLQSKDFKDKDGSTDYDAYTNWKLQERDMQYELQRLQLEQLNQEIEQDRINTERIFKGQELIDYNNLIQTNGKVFADTIHEYDENNVIFKYLDTVDDYPIVLRELMTNSSKWLPQIFRSNRYSRAVIKDSSILERNTAKVVEEILDNYYNTKKSDFKSDFKSETVAWEAVNPQQPVKNNIPIIGKQITQSGAGNSDNEVSLLSSINSINNFLRKNKRR